MPAPKAVLEAEAEADRLIAEMAGAEAEKRDNPEPVKTEEAAGQEPPAAEKAEEPKEQEPKPDESASLRAQLEELEEKYRKLKAQHDTLRGKTYAEVPRVIGENKSLRDRIAELEGQLAQRQATQDAPVRVAKAAEILGKIKEDVAEDVADNINRLVEAVVEQRISEKIAPVASSIDDARKTAREMAEERYVDSLTRLVPDWREIAEEPEYLEFLNGTDELTGYTLYDLAKSALNDLSADRMAKFYNKYKSLRKPATTPQKQPVPSKESLVEPKGSVTSKRDAGSEKEDRFTVKQLEQFTRDRREKRFTAQQEAELEARIDRAIQRGWIDS